LITNNLFLDYSNKTKLTPYFGAGVGLAIWEYDYAVDGLSGEVFDSVISDPFSGSPSLINEPSPASNISEKDTGTDLAYQLMAGVAYDFTDNIKVTAGYRLFVINNDYDFVAHSTELGIRYSF